MPPEYLSMFLEEDDTLPTPDAVLGLDDPDGEELKQAPGVDELLQDPDVRAVVAAGEGLVPAA